MSNYKKSLKNKGNIKTAYKAIGFIILILLALFVMFAISNNKSKSKSTNYDIGNPAKGEIAPNFKLQATDGSMFDLSEYRGQTVLLFFQEGIMCQACWAQLKDIEANFSDFEELGIDQIVTITTDPILPLLEFVNMNEFKTTVLSDKSIRVSESYNTNLYGMPGMGTNYNGHSFILVNDEGVIDWRADYGRYTMYVPLEELIAEIKKEAK